MRKWLRAVLGGGVGLLAALVPQLAHAASGRGDYATIGVDMVILAVMLAAVFLWLYSVVA